MLFQVHSHRHAEVILQEDQFRDLWEEIQDVILGISDDDLSDTHKDQFSSKMSLSHAINYLLKERFVAAGWLAESPIFQEDEYQGNRWRLDMVKRDISIEVAFNHGEAVAWNLLKPVMASELNHVQKAIQTRIGVIICCTPALKAAGAFDSSVGDMDKFISYLKPLSNVLTVPMILIGLEAPKSFVVEKRKEGRRHLGVIVSKGELPFK